MIFTLFQHYLGHFLTLFQLYIITTNRPCEAVGVNEANGFLLPIVLLLEIAQIKKDLPGGFVGFVHLVVMLNLPLVIDRSLRLLS